MIDKLIGMIVKASQENNVIRPCYDDWERSFTVHEDKLILWFNVPCREGWTTKIIKEA